MSKSNKKLKLVQFGDLKVGDEFSAIISGNLRNFVKTDDKQADSTYMRSSWPFDADEEVQVFKK